MPIRKCKFCRCEHDWAEFDKAVASGKQEEFCYAALVTKIKEAIVNAKQLCSEAHRAGDQETVWVCQQAIKQHEGQLAGLRKPGEPRR